MEKARHNLLLRNKIQQELINTRAEGVPKSETASSLDTTLSNDSMDREHDLLDRCVKLMMRNQPPVLSPPPFKVSPRRCHARRTDGTSIFEMGGDIRRMLQTAHVN